MAAKRRRPDYDDEDEGPARRAQGASRTILSSLPEEESEDDGPIRVIKRQGPNLYRGSESYTQTERTMRSTGSGKGRASVSTARNTIEGRPSASCDTNESPYANEGRRGKVGLSEARGEGSTEGDEPPSVFNRLHAGKGKHSIVRANGIGRMRVGY